MSKQLTVAACKKYAPQKKRREIWDVTRGLVLIVQPSGKKTWALRFRRHGGRLSKLTLGDFSETETGDEPVLGAPLSLSQARILAIRKYQEHKLGKDIIEEHKASKRRDAAKAEEKVANTFGAACRQFFIEYKTRHKEKERPRRWRSDARLLGLKWPKGCDPAKVAPEIVPGSWAAKWADRVVTEIDVHDIRVVVDEARRFGIPGTKPRNGHISDARGRKLHAGLSQLYRWLLRMGRVTANPCVGVWHGDPPKVRERTLTDDEIKSLWRATDKIGAPFGAVLKLMLLTGARKNEVTAMRRDELTDDGIWTIPGTRTKNHRALVVPLPLPAQKIIAAVPRIEGGLVFTTNGRTPISGFSKMKVALDAAMGVKEPWRLHDLRRTCASGMQRLGVRTEVIERALNHISGSFRGVAGTYQRDPLSEEVKAALLRWAAHVNGLVTGKTDKVVKLRS